MRRTVKRTAGMTTLTCLLPNAAVVLEPFWRTTSLRWAASGTPSVSSVGWVTGISEQLTVKGWIPAVHSVEARGDVVSLTRRSASPRLWTAVSLNTTASRTARYTTTSAAARSAPAARSRSLAAASPPWPRSFTRSTLRAPSAWSSSTKERSKSRTKSRTVTAASSSSSARTDAAPRGGGGAWSNQVCAADSIHSEDTEASVRERNTVNLIK